MFERYDIRNWQVDWSEVGVAIFILTLALVIAYLIYRVMFALIAKVTPLSATQTDHVLIDRMRAPIRWSILAVAVTVAAEQNAYLGSLWEPLARFLRPALLGWIAYTLVKGFSIALELRMEHTEDAVAMRSRRTRIAILSRTATVAIIVITIGLMMLSVPGVRDIGTTLLASAGFAALAIGAAAQPALKSLIAGLQMAITEPVRIGDLVVVDGHTGRVEEIKMSFVTVRTWDERVIVVPTPEFLDQSFENWTRKCETLSGPVFLHLDPIADVEPIREEFIRYVGEHSLWDKRTASVLVTEAHPETVELRMAVSADSVADLFALRCAAREHMLKWLRENQPEALIRHRLEVPNPNDGPVL